MKTPRDILFARHQAVEPKLDAIRGEQVAELNKKEKKEQSWPASVITSLLCCSNKLWLELVWPCRRIWTGLALIWILLLLFNISQRDTLQTVIVKSPPSPELMMTFRDQQMLLNELLANRSLPVEAELPRNYSPKPRTESLMLMTA